ncbi:MAG TPA: LysR substrate-binding domain-containing protein [Allosphingosinicella sp.]
MSRASLPRGRTSPSLNALQTFEAAARLGSLTKAADELSVTVSAVAFQVRQVESALGTRLIARAGRSVEVSAEAGALARELCAPFEAIRRSVARFRSAPPADVVTVSMLPSFASMWLLPRLSELEAACPEVELRISTSTRRVRLEAEGIDCAIRCGEGGWDGVEAALLFPQLLAPLSHPAHVERFGSPASAADLAGHSLVAIRDRQPEWDEWFATFAPGTPAPAPAHLVDGRELALAAVRSGLGVGLLDVSVLGRELRRGDLVQMLPHALDTGWSHFLLTPSGSVPSPACRRFGDWLKAAARADG